MLSENVENVENVTKRGTNACYYTYYAVLPYG